MSTQNPEVTQDEPVLVLDDKKYVIADLSDEAKYFVACLNSLGQKRQNLQMELDQVSVSTEGFTARLKEAVEDSGDEDVSEVEAS